MIRNVIGGGILDDGGGSHALGKYGIGPYKIDPPGGGLPVLFGGNTGYQAVVLEQKDILISRFPYRIHYGIVYFAVVQVPDMILLLFPFQHGLYHFGGMVLLILLREGIKVPHDDDFLILWQQRSMCKHLTHFMLPFFI